MEIPMNFNNLLIKASKTDPQFVALWCHENNKPLSKDLFTPCSICKRIVFIGSNSCPHCKALGKLKNTGKGMKPFVYKNKGMIKVGRNEPCPCKSGKKFKKCCGVE
jgi:hypothetical protein